MELSNYELDMFNEIGNVGVGNAATALSVIIGKKINISLPTTKLVTKDVMFGDINSEILIVMCRIEGDLDGNIVVIYNKENAFELIDLMNGNPEGTLNEVDELAKSAFKEMVNIIAGPYLDSLAQMMNLRLLPKPPIFNYGKLISIRDSLLNQLPLGVEEILYVKAMMTIDGKKIFGDMYIVFDKKSLVKVMDILKKVN